MIASTEEIDVGRAGTRQTLARIEEMVQRGKRDPRLRAALIHEALPHARERDADGEIRAVIDWVRRRTRYVHDPLGVELVQEPAITLGLDSSHPLGAGDCDDFVGAARAALETLGYPTRSRVIGRHPDQYHHVYLEVRHPRRGWMGVDPIAKKKPFGWTPPAAHSETYAMHTPAPPVPRPIMDQENYVLEEMKRRMREPGTGYRGPAGAVGRPFRVPNRVALGGPLSVSRGQLGRFSGGLGDLGVPYGPDIDPATKKARMERARQDDIAAQYSRSIKALNLQAHKDALRLMEAYGGGYVLKGSKMLKPTSAGVWRHGKYPTQGGPPQETMCGPYPCVDLVNLHTHPWFKESKESGDWTEPARHVVEGPFYKLRGWANKDAKGKELNQWDETGGVLQHAGWMWLLDVDPNLMPNAPGDYVEDWKQFADSFMRARQKQVRYRAKKKKKQGRTLGIATIGVGALATAVTLGLGAPILGSAFAAGGAGSILGGVSGGITAAQLKKAASEHIQKAGVKEIQAEEYENFLDAVSETASTKAKGGSATTGVPQLDNAIDAILGELQAAKARAAAAAPAAPQNFTRGWDAIPGRPTTPEDDKLPGWVLPTAIAGGVVLLAGLGVLAFRR